MDNGMKSRDRTVSGKPAAGRQTARTAANTASWQMTGRISVPDDRTGTTIYDLPPQPLPQITPRSGRVKKADVTSETGGVPTGAYRRSAGTAQWQTGTVRMPEQEQTTEDTGRTPRSRTAYEGTAWERTGRNPFEEPGDSPELEGARNPRMYDKSSEFWQGDRYGTDSGENKREKSGGDRAGKTSGDDSHHLRNMILSAAALLLLLIATGLIVFRVREIRVAGCSHVSAETVVACSGITTKNNLLLLNEKRIEEGINANRYLQYVCIERNAPSSVTIRVKERVPIAYMNYCGIRYIMDKSLMVLEEEHVIGSMEDMIEIKGLRPKSCFLGARVNTEEEQGRVYTEMMREIRVLGIRDMITEIDISDTDSIYLLTSDGMSVSLGDGQDIHAKLRSMVLTHEELIRRDLSGGSINVSKPENPTYVPFEQ